MNKNRRKDGRWVESFIGKAFVICLLVIIIVNLLVPDKKKSDQENRMLTQRPSMTVDSLASGSYMEQFENYRLDQFAGRGLWRKLKVALNRLGGSREENDVFIGRNDQLLEDIAVPDPGTLNRNVKAIKKFAADYKHIPVTMLLAPDAASILSGKLPALATVADQSASLALVKKELGGRVQWVDAASAMNKHKNEKIYYKTDQHWTTLGAFYAFTEASDALGIKTDLSSAYAAYPVTVDFNGALAAKSGCRMGVKEEIDIYVPKVADNDVIVNYVDEQKKRTSLYDSAKLGTRDKYGLFLGGNSSVIDIRTVAESQKKLLIIKDSFANCFVPFLTPYYREIVMVDPRYYTGNIKDIMDTYKITDVLFLYSGNTFFRDNNISGVLSGE